MEVLRHVLPRPAEINGLGDLPETHHDRTAVIVDKVVVIEHQPVDMDHVIILVPLVAEDLADAGQRAGAEGYELVAVNESNPVIVVLVGLITFIISLNLAHLPVAVVLEYDEAAVNVIPDDLLEIILAVIVVVKKADVREAEHLVVLHELADVLVLLAADTAHQGP